MENLLSAPGWSVQRALRLGLASYFVCVVLGVLHGPTVSFLFAPFVDKIGAHLLGNAVLAGLSVCILMGWARSAAAVVLALLLFIASYLEFSAHFLQSGHYHADAVPMFWRDFAIIVLLLLSCSDSDDAFEEPTGPSRKTSILMARPVLRPEPAPPPIKPLSRGSVQQSFQVSSTGRAVSRQLSDEDQRRLINDVIEAG